MKAWLKGGFIVKLIILLILIIIIAIAGVIGYYYLSQPKVISESTEIVSSCTDSDGNDIYKKGSSQYNYDSEGEGGGGSEDFCDYFHPKTDRRVGILNEGLCENNEFKRVSTTCGWGFICRNGACVKGDKDQGICSDTDYGNEPNKRGRINGYGGSGLDECWISSNINPELDGGYTNECNGENCYVYEYYCNGDNKENEIIPCSNGCINGACS